MTYATVQSRSIVCCIITRRVRWKNKHLIVSIDWASCQTYKILHSTCRSIIKSWTLTKILHNLISGPIRNRYQVKLQTLWIQALTATSSFDQKFQLPKHHHLSSQGRESRSPYHHLNLDGVTLLRMDRPYRKITHFKNSTKPDQAKKN